MKKYTKLILADILIAAAAVILYSPGLVNLRITDYSIFRAGMSVIAGIVLVGLFFFLNIRMLREPKKIQITTESISDLDKAKTVLKSYVGGEFFGSMARTVIDQMDRTGKCQEKLSGIIEEKFAKGTISWEKFYSVVKAAEASAIKNVVSMARRMDLFDEAEYGRLQHYKDDDIPDDIQEERMKLYQENFASVKSVIALNERILLKMDALAMELSTSELNNNEEVNTDLLGELERLIEETKYYQ